MTATVDSLLRDADAGMLVADLARRYSLPPGRVYSLLREHRPDRRRSPRTRTAALPVQIRGMLGLGLRPARVAFLLGITRAYVYAVRGSLQKGT